MSLSLVGFSVAATRQNAGTSLNPAFTESCERSSGRREKSPTLIGFAWVMVALGSASDDSVAHEVPPARAALVGAELAAASARKIPERNTMQSTRPLLSRFTAHSFRAG